MKKPLSTCCIIIIAGLAIITNVSGKRKTKAASKANSKAIEKLIVGSFKLKSDIKSKDFDKFLKAMEYSDDDRKTLRNVPGVEIKVTKDAKKSYSCAVTAGLINMHKSFKLGKEFHGRLFGGRQYKGKITFEGDNKVILEEKHIGFNCRHVLKFSKKGFKIKYNCKQVVAVQEFRRRLGRSRSKETRIKS